MKSVGYRFWLDLFIMGLTDWTFRAIVTKQIIRNIASNYARMALTILSSLFLMPLILSKLGAEALGLWVLINTIAGYFALSDLGITNAATKYISQHRATQQWEELNKTISTSLLLFTGLSVLVFSVAVLVAQFLPELFHLSPSLVNSARLLTLIAGAVAAFGFMNVIPIQCAIAAQRQDILNLWMLALQFLTTCMSLIAVNMGFDVVILGCFQMVSTFGNGLIGLLVTRKYLPQAEFRIKWHREHGLVLASFAGYSLLATLAVRVIYYSDTMVIGHCLSIAAIASYAIALKICDFMRAIVNCGAGVLGTFVCELSALRDVESLSRMWLEGSKWSIALALPICIFCILLGSDLIRCWLNQDYPVAVAVLSILVIGNVFDLAQSVGFQIIVNGGKIRPYALFVAAEAVANLTLSLILIKSLGLVGVAIGTVIPQIIRTAIFSPLLLRKETNVDLATYLSKAVVPALFAGVPSVFIITIYKLCQFESTRMSMCLLSLALAASQLFGMFTFCVNQDMKQRLMQKFVGLYRQRLFKEPSASQTSCPVQIDPVD